MCPVQLLPGSPTILKPPMPRATSSRLSRIRLAPDHVAGAGAVGVAGADDDVAQAIAVEIGGPDFSLQDQFVTGTLADDLDPPPRA